MTERRPLLPFLIRSALVAAAAVIPLRVVAHGYRPTDDALRHAAKAVSGRPWSDILVLRADMAAVDSHPGWHALLRLVHRATGADALWLVWFSIVFLFALFAAAPMLRFRRPEAWMASLLLLAVADWPVFTRLLQGRPLLWSMAVVVSLCLLWPRLEEEPPWRWMAVVVLLVASATWVHAAWYLFALPVVACAIADRMKLAGRMGLATAGGIALGALLTGQPFAFLRQGVLHGFLALGHAEPASTLAVEFLPFAGSPLMALSVAALLLWRRLRGSQRRPVGQDPAFVLGALGWALGFVAIRFWSDWGVPALLVWIAGEFQEPLEAYAPEASWRRAGAAAALALTTTLAVSADVGGRWSVADRTYAPLLRKEARALLPDDGGVLYSGDMRIFFETFFRYPTGRWRYIVGYEPGLMPPEDLQVYRQLLTNLTPETVDPWVRKMRPQDRLIIGSVGAPPPVPALEWQSAGGNLWSGRVRTGSPP